MSCVSRSHQRPGFELLQPGMLRAAQLAHDQVEEQAHLVAAPRRDRASHARRPPARAGGGASASPRAPPPTPRAVAPGLAEQPQGLRGPCAAGLRLPERARADEASQVAAPVEADHHLAQQPLETGRLAARLEDLHGHLRRGRLDVGQAEGPPSSTASSSDGRRHVGTGARSPREGGARRRELEDARVAVVALGSSAAVQA